MQTFKSDIETPHFEKAVDPWIPVLYQVEQAVLENNDLITLIIQPVNTGEIPSMKPGQFNMIYVFGIGEIPISVSRLSENSSRIHHTIQNVGAVSGACCKLKKGDLLGVRGPFGSHWPLEYAKGKDILILAGGVGIAPLRPLIESICANRDAYQHVNLLYGTRSPENILFHQDIISWQSDPTLNFQITVDHAFSHWRGNVGVVTNLIDKAQFDPENTLAYICGPEIMMRYGINACLDHQIPQQNLYLSMERNMKCGIGHCGHCQYGPFFICKDGPVFQYLSLKPFLKTGEL